MPSALQLQTISVSTEREKFTWKLQVPLFLLCVFPLDPVFPGIYPIHILQGHPRNRASWVGALHQIPGLYRNYRLLPSLQANKQIKTFNKLFIYGCLTWSHIKRPLCWPDNKILLSWQSLSEYICIFNMRTNINHILQKRCNKIQ